MLRGTLIYVVLWIVADVVSAIDDPFRARHPLSHSSADLSPVGLSPVGVQEHGGAQDPFAVDGDAGAQDPFQRKYHHRTSNGMSRDPFQQKYHHQTFAVDGDAGAQDPFQRKYHHQTGSGMSQDTFQRKYHNPTGNGISQDPFQWKYGRHPTADTHARRQPGPDPEKRSKWAAAEWERARQGLPPLTHPPSFVNPFGGRSRDGMRHREAPTPTFSPTPRPTLDAATRQRLAQLTPEDRKRIAQEEWDRAVKTGGSAGAIPHSAYVHLGTDTKHGPVHETAAHEKAFKAQFRHPASSSSLLPVGVAEHKSAAHHLSAQAKAAKEKAFKAQFQKFRKSRNTPSPTPRSTLNAHLKTEKAKKFKAQFRKFQKSFHQSKRLPATGFPSLGRKTREKQAKMFALQERHSDGGRRYAAATTKVPTLSAQAMAAKMRLFEAQERHADGGAFDQAAAEWSETDEHAEENHRLAAAQHSSAWESAELQAHSMLEGRVRVGSTDTDGSVELSPVGIARSHASSAAPSSAPSSDSGCVAGQYLGGVWGDSCEDCPLGKWTNDGEAKCRECGTCSAGHTRSGCGVGPGQCSACPSGQHRSLVRLECVDCAPGRFQPHKGGVVCISCPASKYAEGRAAIVCKSCPAGTETTTGKQDPASPEISVALGAKACRRCSAGKFASPGVAFCQKCVHCKLGLFNSGCSGSGSTRSECLKCPVGKYGGSDLDERISTAASGGQCHLCAPGQFQATSGALRCNRCEEGRSSDAGSKACHSIGVAPTAHPTPKPTIAVWHIADSEVSTPNTMKLTNLPTVFPTKAPTPPRLGSAFGQPAPKFDGIAPLGLQPVGIKPVVKALDLKTAAAHLDSKESSHLILPTKPSHARVTVSPTPSTPTPAATLPAASLDCPPGTQSHRNSLFCSSCPAGQFSLGGLGAICIRCPAGRYGLGASGSGVCSGPCPAGRYGVGGSSDAQCDGNCPAGRYGEGGSTGPSCDGPCPAGRYGVGGSTQRDCDGACPKGRWSEAAARGIAACHAFIVPPAPSPPLFSMHKTTSSTTTTTVLPTVIETTSALALGLVAATTTHVVPRPSARSASAMSLAADTRADAEAKAVQASAEAVKDVLEMMAAKEKGGVLHVKAKDTGTGIGAENAIAQGVLQRAKVRQSQTPPPGMKCPAGTFWEGRCRSCTAGKYSIGGHYSMCLECPAGRYGLGGSSSPLCSAACPAGRYGSGGSPTAACSGECAAGRWGRKGAATSDCTGPCLPGHYGSAGSQRHSCDGTCPPGSYSRAGAMACTTCVPGQYQGSPGQSLCDRCPQGHYGQSDGAVSVNDCVLCPRGQTSGTAAKLCSGGDGIAAGGPVTGPKARIRTAVAPPRCSAGEYLADAQGVGGGTCLICPAGKYSGNPDVEAVVSCLLCAAGRFGLGGSRGVECDGACPAGRYGAGGSTSAECDGACPAGRWGREGSTSGMCDGVCAAGRFGSTGTRAGSPLCDGSCAKGRYSGEAAETCTKCAPGHAQPQKGKDECVQCLRGHFQHDEGGEQCIACPAGMQGDIVVGASTCVQSPATPAPTPATLPTRSPTRTPTQAPTNAPTHSPTLYPTHAPTMSPTPRPTRQRLRSVLTSSGPTPAPTREPTAIPSPLPSPVLRLLINLFELGGVAIPRDSLRRAMRASVADELGLVETDVLILEVSSGSEVRTSALTSGTMDRRRLEPPVADAFVMLSLRLPRDWGGRALQDLRRRIRGPSFVHHLLRRFRTRLLGAGGPALPHHARIQVQTQESADEQTGIHKLKELASFYDEASQREYGDNGSGFRFGEATVSRFEARGTQTEGATINRAQWSAQSHTMMFAVISAAVFVLVLVILLPRRAAASHQYRASGLHDAWHGHGMRGQLGYARVPSVDHGHYSAALRARATSPDERYGEYDNSYASEYEYEFQRATHSGYEQSNERSEHADRIRDGELGLDAGVACSSDYSRRECRRRSR